MSTFYSQYKQDEYIYNTFFQNKKDGFFLEIGADDGLRFSNCAFFEKTLKWKGISIEARESAYQKLIKNRSCICVNAVLSDTKKIAEFMEIEGYGVGLSGLVDKYNPQHVKRIFGAARHPKHKNKKVVSVSTQCLNEILDEYKITHIDFLSIDTEGSELSILKTLDFNKYNIDVITIEDNYEDPKLMKFFLDRKYNYIKKIKCDKIFSKIN